MWRGLGGGERVEGLRGVLREEMVRGRRRRLV